MSMPVFPEINPDITCENAINMILASIAMEELALSHIMNAEGEKLQYVLKLMESSCGGLDQNLCKLLEVNKSISGLLDSVSQNQMLLKGKMEKALDALGHTCRSHDSPCVCKPKCGAAFEAGCVSWCQNAALRWSKTSHRGDCICNNRECPTKIVLCKDGWYSIYFTANVKGVAGCRHDIAAALQAAGRKPLCTVYDVLPKSDAMCTVSMTAQIQADAASIPYPLSLRLLTESVYVEHACLTVTEL